MKNYTKAENTIAVSIDSHELDTSTYVFKSHTLIESGYNFTLKESLNAYLQANIIIDKQGGSIVHNFDEKEYDYDELERKLLKRD